MAILRTAFILSSSLKGGIFDQGDPSSKAFRHAVNLVNADRSTFRTLVRTTLRETVSEIPEGDSFKASKKG